MRTSSLVRFNFALAHGVLVPHFHHNAAVEFEFSSELCEDPASDAYFMGADAVAVRLFMEREVGEWLTNRVLLWDQEASAFSGVPLKHEPGYVVPLLPEVLWSVRPTIEAITFSLAHIAMSALAHVNDDTVQPERLAVFESSRTAGVLVQHQIVAASAHPAASAYRVPLS
jgi:hypothetical protein